MPKPSKFPRWATDVSAVIAEPTESKKDVGWLAPEKPPDGAFNWLFKTIYDWLAWLDTAVEAAIPADNSVTTEKIAAGAVTQVVTSPSLTETFSTTSISYVDVTGVSLSITTSAGTTLAIKVNVPRMSSSASSTRAHLGVNVDGTDYNVGAANNSGSSCYAELYFQLAAGTHTIKLRARDGYNLGTTTIDPRQNNNNASNQWAVCNIVAVEIKR